MYLRVENIMAPIDDNIISVSGGGLDVVSEVDWRAVPLVVWPGREMRVVVLEERKAV